MTSPSACKAGSQFSVHKASKKPSSWEDTMVVLHPAPAKKTLIAVLPHPYNSGSMRCDANGSPLRFHKYVVLWCWSPRGGLTPRF